MLGFADRQADRAPGRVGCYLCEPCAEPLERIGLQQLKTGIHTEGSVPETIDYSGALNKVSAW